MLPAECREREKGRCPPRRGCRVARSPYSITCWQMTLGKSLGISASSSSGAASVGASQNESTLPKTQDERLSLNRLRGERKGHLRSQGMVLWRLAGLEGLGEVGNV